MLTAAAAIDSGTITPETTFPDRRRRRWTVRGVRLTIREHDLGASHAGPSSLSAALQVSSNIYFAHVGLEVGADRFMDYALRFGFCSGLRIGSQERGIPVDASYVTGRADGGGCTPFIDSVELASAAFGQARTAVTPLQMALLAATVANDGTVPDPFVVRALAPSASPPPARPRRDRGVPRRKRHRAMSSQTADSSAGCGCRARPLCRLYPVQGTSPLYAERVHSGQAGTAERGPCWPALVFSASHHPECRTDIAIAVIIEGGGTDRSRGAVGGRGDGPVALWRAAPDSRP